MSILRRGVPWVLLCMVLVAGVAYGISRLQTKKYTATAALVLNGNQLGQQLAGLPAATNDHAQAQPAARVKLVRQGNVAAKTARHLGQGLTEADVSTALRVSARGESNVVSVAATASSARLAAAIANAYTKEFVAERQSSDHAFYASVLKRVTKRLRELSSTQRAKAAGLALRRRARLLAALAELRTGNVQIQHAAAVPTSPSSPRVYRNTIYGGVLGLLVGMCVAFPLERLGKRIREPDDLGRIYGLPVLGVVPRSSALARASWPLKAGSRGQLPPPEEEAFRFIHQRLRYFKIDRDLRTLLVASPAPRDGRTTIARHLAGAAAMMGSVALLVEADLRRPALARQLDLQPGPGLSDVLIDEVSLWSATQLVDLVPPPVAGSARGSLDVLVAGGLPPPNPAELIASSGMDEVLGQAMETYDLVMLDTPPLCVFPDAFPLLRKVDGVIIVGKEGHKRRPARRLHEALEDSSARLLGIVANGSKRRQRSSHIYNPELARAAADDQSAASSDDDASAAPDGLSGSPARSSSPRRGRRR